MVSVKKSSSHIANPLSGTRVRRGFDHLTCLNDGVFDHLFGQAQPSVPCRAGLIIDRYIILESEKV